MYNIIFYSFIPWFEYWTTYRLKSKQIYRDLIITLIWSFMMWLMLFSNAVRNSINYHTWAFGLSIPQENIPSEGNYAINRIRIQDLVDLKTYLKPVSHDIFVNRLGCVSWLSTFQTIPPLLEIHGISESKLFSALNYLNILSMSMTRQHR